MMNQGWDQIVRFSLQKGFFLFFSILKVQKLRTYDGQYENKVMTDIIFKSNLQLVPVESNKKNKKI